MLKIQSTPVSWTQFVPPSEKCPDKDFRQFAVGRCQLRKS